MNRIRVLVVDDSVVMRRLLKEALSEDPGLEVIGLAANGRIALNLLDRGTADVVILDVEMPEMDGLQVLQRIQAMLPNLPVIMFSTLTERGAVATLDALALGARDYVTKPSSGNAAAAKACIGTELIPKIKSLCGFARMARTGVVRDAVPQGPSPTLPSRPFEIVAIGASTGGPNALTELLPQIPKEFPAAVVVVQHMPPTFTRFLAERLNAACQLPVSEASSDEVLEPGKIWIAPGDFHLAVESAGTLVRLRTFRAPPENSCRPAVDVLFRSVARLYGQRAMAIILTGMGQDGLRGCEQLQDAGATIIAQDEATSVVWGMPGFVVNAGLADKVLPLQRIANELVRRVKESHSRGRTQEVLPSVYQPC